MAAVDMGAEVTEVVARLLPMLAADNDLRPVDSRGHRALGHKIEEQPISTRELNAGLEVNVQPAPQVAATSAEPEPQVIGIRLPAETN